MMAHRVDNGNDASDQEELQIQEPQGRPYHKMGLVVLTLLTFLGGVAMSAIYLPFKQQSDRISHYKHLSHRTGNQTPTPRIREQMDERMHPSPEPSVPDAGDKVVQYIRKLQETVNYEFTMTAIYRWPSDFALLGTSSMAEVKDVVRLTQGFYRRIMAQQYPLSYQQVSTTFLEGEGDHKAAPFVVKIDFATKVTFRVTAVANLPTPEQTFTSLSNFNQDEYLQNFVRLSEPADVFRFVESVQVTTKQATTASPSSEPLVINCVTIEQCPTRICQEGTCGVFECRNNECVVNIPPPSLEPTTQAPTWFPTARPTTSAAPTQSSVPSISPEPSFLPSHRPSDAPSMAPTIPGKGCRRDRFDNEANPEENNKLYAGSYVCSDDAQQRYWFGIDEDSGNLVWRDSLTGQMKTYYTNEWHKDYLREQHVNRRLKIPDTKELSVLQVVGHDGQPPEFFPLAECQGDCDQDSECAGSLICYQRSQGDSVPGCTKANGGIDSSKTDYCVGEGATVSPTTSPAPTTSMSPTAGPTEELFVDYYFQLSTNATFRIHRIYRTEDWDIVDDVVHWELPSLYNVTYIWENCLFTHDCPYMHLHQDGVMVLVWIDGNRRWYEKNIKRCYDFDTADVL